MASPVLEGEILAGKYRVERVLGRGGMGVVVAARHVELGELVALKFLLDEAAAEPEAVERFLREARASVRIKSEHVARVHDVGQLESGAPYIVMEYLDGENLGEVLRLRGTLSVEDVVDYVVQACEGLAEAHAAGIVHRDLKPSNLMLVHRSDGSECVKVLDFGISKVAGPGGMSMTLSATVLGSPLYMSPEQMMSPRDVDERTDIWATGIILYELLVAAVPFWADTLPGVSVLVATAEPTPIRELRPEVPPGLEAVVAACLAKNREDRYANVGEVAEALAPFAPPRSRVSIERASRILASAGARAGDRASAIDVSGRTLAAPESVVTPGGFVRTPPGRVLTPARRTPTPKPMSERRAPTPVGFRGAWNPNRTMTASDTGSLASVSGGAGGPSRSRNKVLAAIGVLVLVACIGVAFGLSQRSASGPAAAAASSPTGGPPSTPLASSPRPAASAAAAVTTEAMPQVRAAMDDPDAATATEQPLPTRPVPRVRPQPETTPPRHPVAHTPPATPGVEKRSTYEDM